MILFLNVFVTEARQMGFKYNRYGLPWHNRFDVFKYSLASLSALNPLWSRVVIYCKLDKCYQHKWWELEAFIYSIFENQKIVLRPNRSTTQKAWQDAYNEDLEPVSDSLIWYQGNDDHVFIDYNLDAISDVLALMYKDCTPLMSCMYSHWPEYVRFAAKHRAENYGAAAVYTSFNTDAIHIITKDVFKNWWFTRWWKGKSFVRSDFLKFFGQYPTKCYVPYRELVRHFDGYGHSMPLADCCPPLHIPPGFFKNDIKILYGAKKIQKGWTAVNPLLPYRTISCNGVDHRFPPDEIPLFWRERISEFKEDSFIPTGHAFRARNQQRLAILSPRPQGHKVLPTIPAGWMRKYLIRSLPVAKLL